MKDLLSKPNQITIIRVLLIPIFIYFLLSDLPYRDYIAAFIFIILSLSDALDGYIARKKQQITSLGKLLDPIADKLLISAALIFLVAVERIQLWMAVIIIVREIVITVARLFFLPKRGVISASYLGKVKTISQIIAILAVILDLPFNWGLMLIAVIITVVSGLDYLIKMGKQLEENVLNFPNLITTFRLLLVPLFIINMVNLNTNFALVVFAIIVLSDKLDGVFARLTEQITNFGRIYDAFTDFTLVVSSFVTLYIIKTLDIFWLVMLLIPTIVIMISKISHLRLKEISSSPFGKIIIGISYLIIVSFMIDFVYQFQLLTLGIIMANIYGVFELCKYSIKRKSKFEYNIKSK